MKENRSCSKKVLIDTVLVKMACLGGRPGQVVMGGDSFSRGREFESQCQILNG